MTQQLLRGKRLTPLQGILLIVLFAVSIVLVSWIERALDMATGLGSGRFIVWILIVIEAFFLLRLGFKSYRYTLTEDRFCVEAVYGDQARLVHDIPTEQIAAFGPKDDIFRRYGNGQSYEEATVRGADIPPMALVWRRDKDDLARLLVIQPDDDMTKALNEAVERV